MALGAPTIFISYRRGHEPSLAFIEELELVLTQNGFRILRDVDIEPGERWPDELWRWLMECSAAVAVVSNEAAASDWCRREWAVLAARESRGGLRVIPVRVGPIGPEANILDHIQGVRAGPKAAGKVVQRLEDVHAAPPTRVDYLAAHEAWLLWQFRDAPVLGREPYSLSDVYIETECGALSWGELSADRTIDPFSERHGGRASLIETVLDRFADRDFRDLVVVQSPAGSGKSAFSLRLANRLADEGLTPVLVRFRDLRLSTYGNVDELLQDALRVAPVGEHPPGPTEPLFGPSQLAETTRYRDVDICRTVVILDGWDEVTLTGSTRFKDQLEEWLPRLREYFVDRPGPPVRLLLTGRPSAAIDRSGLLRRETPVLTIRPMRPDQLRSYAGLISDRLDGANWTLDVHECEQAFTTYETWFDRVAAADSAGAPRREPGGPPEAGTDVLGSPLLALLAFRTVADWPGDTADLFEQPTALYHALLEITVAHAGKADEGPQGTVHRGGRSLRRLLQRVATVITCQGGESVSFDELRLRLEDDDALTEWAEQAVGESTLHELVVNFYFKGHQELGCEFLHKSFREYLFAEAIVAALEEVAGEHTGPQPPLDRQWSQDFGPGSSHFRASRSLASLLGPQWLTPEVRSHVFWLIERAAEANRERWVWIRDLLNDLWGWWGESVHLRAHPERVRGRTEWRDPLVLDMILDDLPRDGRERRASRSVIAHHARLGDALLQLTAFAHALLSDGPMVPGRECQTGEPGAVRFRPFNHEARMLIARLGSLSKRPQGHALAGAYLRGVDLSGEDLTACDLRDADLSDADLSDIRGMGMLLSGADLRRATMQNARLFGAAMDLTQMQGSVLAGASLELVQFFEANLEDAKLGKASLTAALLSHANLAGTDLRDADLSEAELIQTHLTEADLTGVDLSGANLRAANLTDADLTDANLTDANLTGAELHDANLTNARLDPENAGGP